MNFLGFREESFQFFADLSANNSVEWFEDHKDQYEEFVLDPMRSLCEELHEDLAALNPAFVRENVDAHFSEMLRGPKTPTGTPPVKQSLYAFFWDEQVRRLSDGNLFVGIGADGVTIGFSIYEFGDPQSRMRRVFKPRLARHLSALDSYIKGTYLRRGFDFHRYVRAASRLGMREVDAFPSGASQWEDTLGWVARRHIHTESSRLTPGSFLGEVRESFERLYPLYVFSSDPAEDFARVLRSPSARAKAKEAKPAKRHAKAAEAGKSETSARAS